MPLYIRNNRELLYVHVPKCAGSTIESYLESVSDHQYFFDDGSKRSFECSPQHFHIQLLENLLPNIEKMGSFVVVRHPLSRCISEHIYRNMLRSRKGEKCQTLLDDVRCYFFEYQFSSFIFDNHIRPQIEFVAPTTKIFYLEDGLEMVFGYIDDYFGITGSKRGLGNKNVSSEVDFVISGKVVNSIQRFYDMDFTFLGYKKIDIGDGENITYRDLKAEVAGSGRVNNTSEAAFVGQYYSEIRFATGFQKTISASRYILKKMYKPFFRLP